MDKKKVYLLLLLILLTGFLFRILPYALGYENLIMGDTVREYEQVLYILENGEINFDFIYGQYPVLHLLIAFVSIVTTLSPNFLFRWLPQLFATLGALIIFLLLRETTNEKIALIGAFILAVFGPHVWWSMKPVRETMGLFIFPLLVYLYYKSYQSSKYLIPLILTSIISIFTHHWSLLMALILIGIFVVVTQDLRLLFIYLSTVSFGFTYIYFTLSAVQSFFGSFEVYIFMLLFGVTIFIIITKLILASDINYLFSYVQYYSNRYSDYAISTCLGLFTLFGLSFGLSTFGNSLVYSYSWYFFTSIILLFVLASFGALESLKHYTKISVGLILSISVYLFVLIAGLLIGYSFYDPGRVVEFLVFPLVLPASVGLVYLAEKAKDSWVKSSLVTLTLLLLFVSSIFVIPVVYLGGEANDIRSYLQYVPEMGSGSINFAYDQSGLIITDNTYVMALYDLLQFEKPSETNLFFGYVSEYDIAASKYNVNVDSIGSEISAESIKIITSGDKVYDNGWSSIYSISEETFKYLYESNPYRWFWGEK
jgi:hypothetical protein